MTAPDKGGTRRAIPRRAAITLASALFIFAAIFIVTAIIFAVAPGMLEHAGFQSNPGVARRAFGLVFFGGAGAILIHVARGLLTNSADARSFIASAITMGVVWIIFELAGL